MWASTHKKGALCFFQIWSIKYACLGIYWTKNSTKKLFPSLYMVCVSSKPSGQTEHVHSLNWTFTVWMYFKSPLGLVLLQGVNSLFSQHQNVVWSWLCTGNVPLGNVSTTHCLTRFSHYFYAVVCIMQFNCMNKRNWTVILLLKGGLKHTR